MLSYRAGHAGHGVSVKDPKSVIHLQRQGWLRSCAVSICEGALCLAGEL